MFMTLFLPIVRLNVLLFTVLGRLIIRRGPFLQLTLPELDTPENKSLRALIDRLRGQRPRFLRVYVIRQRDGSEAKWNLQMMEDAGLDTMSYVDFLCYMHRQIQSSL